MASTFWSLTQHCATSSGRSFLLHPVAERRSGKPRFPSSCIWSNSCTTRCNYFTQCQLPLQVVRSTRDDLAGLGLSAAEVTEVESLVARAGATNVDESIKALVTFSGSVSAARGLVLRHPHLLCCQLPSWIEFLLAFGLTKAQVQHVLCQAPEALVEADLVQAGQSILTFRRLGLSDYAAAQLVTYYPQLLYKDEAEIRRMVDLLRRYQTGAF